MLPAMAVARMAFVFPILFSSLLAGQTTAQSVLKLQVQDASMAPIPNAIISIRCDSGGAQELRTDNVGEATISLDPGLHFISVSAPGFESWKSSVEMKANANRSIRAELKIGAMCSLCVTVADDSSQVELERRSLDVEFLLLPLEALPLPAHKLRLSRPHPRTT